GGSFGPKSLQWAEFKTRDTGAHFAVINNHLLPTIETRGHPNKRFPKRLDGAEKQMAAAMAAADKLQAAGLATFITGDHNIAAKRDGQVRDERFPYVKYAKHGLYSNWRTLGYPSNGTHGRRHIDYVFASNAKAAPIKQTILPRYGSDHNALLVTESNDPTAVKQGTTVDTTTSGGGTPGSANSNTPSMRRLTSGTGPFHLDLGKFNELAQGYRLDELTQEQAANRADAGAAIGKLFEALLAETDMSLTSSSLTSGAKAMETANGTVLELGTDDDSVAAQLRVRTAFVKALGELPIEDAKERAGPWYQLSLMYALGNPPSVCNTGETTEPSSSSTSGASPATSTTTSTSPPARSASVTGDGSDTSGTNSRDSGDESEQDLSDANGNPPAGVLPSTLTATTTSGSAITLDAKQIQHAAEIISYGTKLKLDYRYVQVALMAALQESKLKVYANSRVPESMSYPHEAVGRDHDSVNLFQQRPGAWGSVRQLMDVGFSIGMFFGGQSKPKADGPRGLLDIPDYQSRGLGELAQLVQVSAFPSVYDQWAPVAATILDKVGGIDIRTVGATASTSTCASSGGDASAFLGQCPNTNMKAESQGVTPDALLVTRCVAAAFPTITDIFTYADHEPTEAQAVDIMIPDWQTPAGQELGHDLSRWIQAHQAELGVQYVIWWGQIWNVERNSEGWRTYFDADSSD
ncbi:MAG TPA: endonuclease/exonuclease/phosphatase family protein, partial [Microlunatus sp.]